MQIGQTQAVRNNWYDRSTSNPALYYHANLGPHALTTRVDYDIPVNRTGFIGNISMSLLRSVAGAPVGQVDIQLTIKNSASALIFQQRLVTLQNVAGDFVFRDIPIDLWLDAGSNIEIRTVDTSTGGSVRYMIGAAVTLFDS